MKDMIRTLNPEKKKGVNISKEKYEIIRKAILTTLRVQKEMTFMDLSRAVEKQVNGKFEGSVMWYVTTVKLDLEAARSNAYKIRGRNSFGLDKFFMMRQYLK